MRIVVVVTEGGGGVVLKYECVRISPLDMALLPRRFAARLAPTVPLRPKLLCI